MSRYQHEMNQLNGGGLLDELKKKKMTKILIFKNNKQKQL